MSSASSASSSAAGKKGVTIYTAFRGASDADVERALDYVAKGGCLTEFDDNKMTLLHHAAFGGKTEIVQVLVNVANGTTPAAAGKAQQTVDLDAADSDAWTPLHYAADRGHVAVVKLLVEEAGANVNARDTSKRTPLHLAALGGHRDVAEVLLASGAMKAAKNAVGATPAACATAAGHEELAALLH